MQKTREIIDNVERVLIYSFGIAFIESKGNIVGVYTVPGETSDKVSKIALFFLLWADICLIKGLTVLIPGKEELVELSVPVNTYEKNRND